MGKDREVSRESGKYGKDNFERVEEGRNVTWEFIEMSLDSFSWVLENTQFIGMQKQ